MKKIFNLLFAFLLSITIMNPAIVVDVAANETNTLSSFENYNVSNNQVTINFANDRQVIVRVLDNNMFRFYLGENDSFVEYPAANNSSHTARITVKSDKEFYNENNVEPVVTENDDFLVIKTEGFSLELNKEQSTFELKKANGEIVFSEEQPIEIDNGKALQTLKTTDDEYFFGGGTQNGRFSHKGKVIEIKNTNNWVDGGVASPNPFYWSTNGYGVVRNTFKPGTYDFGNENSGLVTTSHNSNYFDAYYFVDDSYPKLLKDYATLTGDPVQLPEYALYLAHLNCYNRDSWSETSSTNGKLIEGSYYSERQGSDNLGVNETIESLLGDSKFTAQKIIDLHSDNDMPLGWFLPNDGYACGYGQTDSFEGDLENLRNFAEYAKSKGVVTGLWTQANLWPGDSNNPQKDERSINKEAEAGVYSIKTDVAWVGQGYSFGLNGISVAYDEIAKENVKPNIVTLDGWAGTQRYGGIWTGDQTGGNWEYIRFHIPTYIGTSLSGQPNVGSDMDGIFGGKNKIVNNRDFQWKTFTTYLLDMDGWGSSQKNPWEFDEDTTAINRAYLKLKAELVPYTYTLTDKVKQDGNPVIKAMFLEEANAYTLGIDTQYQFMYGDSFLVAPIYKDTAMKENGDDIRNNIYLPSTSDVWFDYFTGDQYKGGQVINNFDAPIWKLPLFVKNGSIVPMYAENNNPMPVTNDNLKGLDKSQRIVEFYPSGTTSFNAYEDDGLKLNGDSAHTLYQSIVSEGTARLTANITKGSYDSMVKNRSTEFIVNVSKEPTAVNGNVGGSEVNFTKVTTLEEYDNASGNVYFYNEQPMSLINKFAGDDSMYKTNMISVKPKLYIKSTDKNDVTVNNYQVVVEGFENAMTDVTKQLDANMENVKNVVVNETTSKDLTFGWDVIDGVDYYEVDFNNNGVIISNIVTPEFKQENLTEDTNYTIRVRAVKGDKFSEYSDELVAKTALDPYRNIPEDMKITWNYGDTWGSINNAFDHNLNSMFHSTNAALNKPLIFDMKKIYSMDHFDYIPRANKGNGAVKRMNVYGSLDGVIYKLIWDGDEHDSWSYVESEVGTKTIPLNNEKVRYLKVVVTDSIGGFFSAAELEPYKLDGNKGQESMDYSNSGLLDEGDLTFLMNYAGLKKGIDSDFDYVSIADVNYNGLIDSYDLSYVTRNYSPKLTNFDYPVAGGLSITADKNEIKVGEEVNILIKGNNLVNVNALDVEIPIDKENFEFVKNSFSEITKEMCNNSTHRIHTDKTEHDYIVLANYGSTELLSGNVEIATVTLRAKKDTEIVLKDVNYQLVGRDSSTIIDNADVIKQSKIIKLAQIDIKSFTFTNDVVGDDNDGSEIWQQQNWEEILFDNNEIALAEFSWDYEGHPVNAAAKLPTDFNINLNESKFIKSFKIIGRTSGNGAIMTSKLKVYNNDILVNEFDIQNGANPTFEINSRVDKFIFTPITSSGTATLAPQGLQANRMLSVSEIEIIEEILPQINKELLEEKIAIAEAINTEDYTEASALMLIEKINNAKSEVLNLDSTVDSTTKAVEELNSAINNLEYALKVLGLEGIKSLTFTNEHITNDEGIVLFQQSNFKELLFDESTNGNLAEFKWYFEEKDINEAVMLPTSFNIELNDSKYIKTMKVFARDGGNGGLSTSKLLVYNNGELIKEFEVKTGSNPEYIIKCNTDKLVFIPLTSTGIATNTKTGTEENRMISLYEIKLTEDIRNHLDKNALQASITQANSTDLSKYTEETINVFKIKLDNAKVELVDENSTIETVQTALNELTLAKTNLSLKIIIVDKSDLEIAINAADLLDTTIYTEETVIIFTEKLVNAKEELVNEDSTNESVKTALDELTIAKTNLSLKVITVDKVNLGIAINTADLLDTTIYTEETVIIFTEKLVNAKEELVNEDSTNETVKTALDELTLAKTNLVLKEIISLDKLNSEIQESEKVSLALYTEDSREIFIVKLNIAKEKSTNPDSQEAIDIATTELCEARKGLVKKEVLNKDILESTINAIDAVDLSVYSDETVAELMKVIDIAKIELVSETSTADTVANVINQLEAARANLILKPIIIDKTLLQAAINEAENLDVSKFTIETVINFNADKNAAILELKNDNSTTETVLEAINKLTISKNALTLKAVPVNKSLLESKVNESIKFDTSKYTSETIEEFSNKLEQAKLILQNEESTQVQVDLALAELSKSKNDLIVKPVIKPTPTPTPTAKPVVNPTPSPTTVPSNKPVVKKKPVVTSTPVEEEVVKVDKNKEENDTQILELIINAKNGKPITISNDEVLKDVEESGSSSVTLNVHSSTSNLLLISHKLLMLNKNIVINIFDDNQKLIGMWTIESDQEMKNDSDLDVSMMVQKLSGDLDAKKLAEDKTGYVITFFHEGILPRKSIITIDADGQFENNDEIIVSFFNEETNKLEEISKVKVVNNQISFAIEHCSKYVLTKNSIKEDNTNVEPVSESNESTTDKTNYTGFIAIFAIIGAAIIGFVLYKKKEQE